MIYTLTLNPAVDREMTVPRIEFDTVLRATTTRVDWGGKGFNVSRMLASLGTESVAVGFAGGPTGTMLADGLAALGIATEFVPIEGTTRTNVSFVESEGDRHVKVNEAGPTIRPTEQAALVERVRALAQEGDWWVLAGSVSPGLPATIYATLIDLLHAAGSRVLLDSSGEALRHGAAAGPALIKPNDVELAALTGMEVESPAALAAAARQAVRLGAGAVLVSLGSKGALLVSGEGEWRVPAPRIDEGNPIGAGDSMVAGVARALSQGDDLPEALRWGVACGAATAARPGTSVGSLEEVQYLLDQVEAARPL